MSATTFSPPLIVFKESTRTYLAFAVAAGLLYAFFRDGLHDMVGTWERRPEYSFGYMIPIIVGFLIWQRKDVLERTPARGSWLGVGSVGAGIALSVLGVLGVAILAEKWGFLLAAWGLALAYLGIAGFRVIAVPLLMLSFMLPLPEFVLQSLSSKLQLVSSQLGVTFIRLCNISVHLDGNVIDLGALQLQVAEACSGLRYLFSLITLGIIAAYFFHGAWWKRLIIVLATLPISVLMNSFRIGLIGVTVEYWGIEMAQGILHDFEGWIIFMGCTAMLIGLMWVLAHVGKERLPLRSAFGLDFPAPTPKGASIVYRPLPTPFIAGMALLAAAIAGKALVPERVVVKPERKDFLSFPLEIGERKGRMDKIEKIYLDILKADDTLLADYVTRDRMPVNLYIAYFGAQSRDVETHSPRNCIPGGGWEIVQLEDKVVPEAQFGGQPLKVNRVLIAKGDNKQLVYYWFQQRGRNITHEYAAKYYILVDQLRMNRSDGSMIRLTTPIRKGEQEGAADARLAAFAADIMPLLPPYIPN